MVPFSDLWSILPTAMPQVTRALLNEQRPEAGPADDAERTSLPIQVAGNVAIVSVGGPILRRESFLTRYLGFSSSDAVRRAVLAAADDEQIDQILMVFDTPGGTIDGLAEAADTLADVAAAKPITAHISGMCCSAGYYLASQATAITAGRADVVGSIGVRSLFYDFSEMFAADGVEAVPIDTGEFKSAGAFGTKITEAQRADFQRVVDAYMADFRAAVMRGRGVSEEKFATWADGRVYHSEREALGMGLIDDIMTTEQQLETLHQPRRSGRKTTAARARLAMLARA